MLKVILAFNHLKWIRSTFAAPNQSFSMKHLFFLLTALPSLLHAQITITNADLINGPATYTVATALTAPGFNANTTGPNQNWDFSNLEALTTADETYVAVSSTPFAYQFLFNNPFDSQYQSSHAAPQEGFPGVQGFEISDIFTYYKNTASDYRLTGMGISLNGIPLAAKSEPVDKIYEFPLEFDNQTSAYTTTTFDVPTLLLYKMKQTRSNHVDGWGTLTTPAGTFQVLRVKTTLDITDSISVEFEGFPFTQEIPRPQTIEYKWLANGYEVPLLTITETMGQVTGVRFYDGPVSVEEQQPAPAYFVYPNPAADYIMLAGIAQGTKYQIVNSGGKIVKEGRYKGYISIYELAADHYFFISNSKDTMRVLQFIKE